MRLSARHRTSSPARPRRMAAVHVFNAAGAALRRAGMPLVSLDPEELMEAARHRIGLDDFGDGSFREGLSVLLDAYEHEARLNLAGRIVARADTLHLLANRLRIEADLKRYPAIAREEIRRPLFITGLPRSGTTLLHSLLAQDPGHRAPAGWEIMHPSPPPEREQTHTDPRIAKAERQIRWLDRLAPDFKTIHPVSARQPEECIAITSHAFLSARFHTTYWVPSYEAWLERQDMRPAYAYHRRFLQHLQWRWPGDRWVLKSPAHLFTLPALFDVYPDALIVQTHRDPTKVLGSVASLSAMLQGAFSDEIDLSAIGRQVRDRWAAGLDHMRHARSTAGCDDGRFLDVHYSELTRDPMAVVRRIYTHFGFCLTPQAEARMRRFLAENPQNRHGVHRYSLSQFGLEREATTSRYEAYRAQFGVESESI